MRERAITILLFVLFAMFFLAVAATAATIDDEVSFSGPAKVGPLNLAPGLYKVKIQGSIVFFTAKASKQTLSTVVRVEKTDKKSPFTAVQGPTVDGVQQIDSILLQGANYRLAFAH
jgi:hypothetical protein